MQNTILIGIYVAVGLYLLYRLFFKKNKFAEDYQKMYNKVLNSDEYKVKGQYEK